MTSEELARLKAICDAASLGPWKHHFNYIDLCSVKDSNGDPIFLGTAYHPTACGDLNAIFIAEARTAMPALLEEVQRLQQKLEIAKEALEKLK